MNRTGELFTSLGGTFLSSPEEIREKYTRIRTFVFDWDGVFNDGQKHGELGSLFSEPDSMGVNLLRFNFYYTRKSRMHSYIVTGLNNAMAIEFAGRENFDAVYLNYKFKEEAFKKICEETGSALNEVAFIFDDILDFGMAKKCGLSFMVHRKASPLTSGYAVEKRVCDYITNAEGGSHAVREVCELLMGLSGTFKETIEKRMEFRGDYEIYLKEKSGITPRIIHY